PLAHLWRQPVWRRPPIFRARSLLWAVPGAHVSYWPDRAAARRGDERGESPFCAAHAATLFLSGLGQSLPVCLRSGLAALRARRAGAGGAANYGLERNPGRADAGGRAPAQPAARLQRT